MGGRNDLPQIMMKRPDLEDLPEIELPGGFECRHYRDGDEDGWNRLMDEVFEREKGKSDFEKEMIAGKAFRPERVWFIETDGPEIVATASAWYVPRYGPETGVLHWVAVRPDSRGRRLGRAVSLAAMHQAAREGRTCMVLSTDDYRAPAAKTYLRLGFRPLLRHESHAERWRRILAQLDWPERFEEILEGGLVTFEDEDA